MAHTRYSFEEGIRAQTALRRAAHLPPESFSIEGFVSSVREEIDTLRGMGLCDDQIAEIVRQHSSIYITGNEVSVHSSPRHESRPR